MHTLLVANDGGHIQQLRALQPRFGLPGRRTWMTVRTPQTLSLLAGEEVHWMHPAPTRGTLAAFRNAVTAARYLRRERIDVAISTGASLALSVLPLANLLGAQ